MEYVLKGYGNVIVEEKYPIIKVENRLFKMEEEKAMFCDMHIYTVCNETRTLTYGPDYKEYQEYMSVKPMHFAEWSKLKEEYDPEEFVLDGKMYKVKGGDRSWPLPELMYEGKVVGHIDAETDMDGETERKIKWL